MGNNGEKIITTFGSLVPQLFFDIIAWILPGAFAASIIAVTAVGLADVKDFFIAMKQAPIGVSIVLGIAFSYSLGVLLNGLWAVLNGEWCRRKKVSRETSKPDIQFQYHRIKHHSIDAGNIILKVKARKHMARVLAAGFVVGFLINGYNNYLAGLDATVVVLYFVHATGLVLSCNAQCESSDAERRLIADYSKILFGNESE